MSRARAFALQCWHVIRLVPMWLVIVPIRAYQLCVSPFLGRNCRFHPSCSQYFILAVKKYGVVSGTVRGVWRIMKCHPFHPGGYDPP